MRTCPPNSIYEYIQKGVGDLIAPRGKKYHAIWQEILDNGGRYTTPEEFDWIQNSFRDRYNPIRLALILSRNSDLRIGRAIEVRFKDFKNGFEETHCTNNKPRKRTDKKTGIIKIKTKPSNQPLPESLITDLNNYIEYRLRLGHYIKDDLGNVKDIGEMRVFTGLTMQRIHNWFHKARMRYGDEQPWLKEPWCILHYFNEGMVEEHSVKLYRVAPYEGRGNFITAAYVTTNFDGKATQLIAGHDKMETTMRYTKRARLKELKIKVKEELERNYRVQPTPLLMGQRKLMEAY